MNVCDALKARKSVRAFLDKQVGREVIERLLDAARHAPPKRQGQILSSELES
ncbi:MAG: nitroreductase family protein [Mariprofundaceae bacterium]|nr:nitroreductase family protein [Mariprofundaceae bacterium]